MEPWKESACEQTAQIVAKNYSAVELCQRYLERIDRLDTDIGSYLRVDTEGALASAQAVDDKIAKGETVGLLAGVPIGLKDLIVTKDLETTAGSKILQHWVPPYDSTAVRALRDADAVVLGKLNLDEFAMGSSNEHSSYKPCVNPWDAKRVPGGSSGGSAAAVAADLCSVSLGTDTGGSIRQPASFCGVLGIKPTYGRISRYGLIAYASSLDQIGPLAHTAQDAALLLEAIAGHDPLDATSAKRAVPRYRDACEQDIKGLRIGIAKEMSGSQASEEVRRAVGSAGETLEKAGATLVSISLPHTQYALSAYYIIATAEASSNLSRYDGVRFGMRKGDNESLEKMYEMTRGAGFGTEVKRRIMLGTFTLRAGHYDAYYKKAQQVRALITQDFSDAFKDVDVILSPTSPTTAFAIGEKASPMEMYQADLFTLSCNLAGLPGLSMCVGFDAQRLPIGAQLLAAPWQEELLFRCAGQYQRDTDWHLQRPDLA